MCKKRVPNTHYTLWEDNLDKIIYFLAHKMLSE